MTKPRAWRGCLNQILIHYLLQACTSSCSSVPAGFPCCWHGEPGQEGALAQHHPLQHPELAGGQGSVLPPSARQGALRRWQE